MDWWFKITVFGEAPGATCEGACVSNREPLKRKL